MHAGRGAATTPIAGRVAYLGEGGNLYVCDAKCDKPICLTCAPKAEQALAEPILPVGLGEGIQAATSPSAPAAYDLPTFAPDGTQIAYASVRRTKFGPAFGINTYDLNRRVASVIFQSPDRPIYFFWMPGGERLLFLAGDAQGLKLMLAQAHEGRPVRVLLRGLPLFFDWSPGLNDLAFHYVPAQEEGPEQVGLMNVTPRDQRVAKVIATGKAPFRNPAWSPDGTHLAYVVDNKRGQFVLTVANADAGAPRAMVGLAPATTAFVWAPDSRHIAFSTLKQEGKMSYDGVNLLDIASGNVSTLVSDPVIAYNFSPDGKWLAYIGTSETSNTWNVVAASGGQSRKLCDFTATSAESAVYRVFDQYALSHRIWSPDSRAIVFAGVMLKEGQEPSDMLPPPSVWMVPIDGGAPRALADGSLAFWSPR